MLEEKKSIKLLVHFKKFYITRLFLQKFFENSFYCNNIKGYLCRVIITKRNGFFLIGMIRTFLEIQKKNRVDNFFSKKKILIRTPNFLKLFSVDSITNQKFKKSEIKIFSKIFFLKKKVRNSFWYNNEKFFLLKKNFLNVIKKKKKLKFLIFTTRIKIKLVCS
jgi:hypothetical protein